MHFADHAHIPTPGDRGKTTRRRSTKTVRGPEGQWIASVKEELAAQPKPPPAPRFVVAYEVSGWYDRRGVFHPEPGTTAPFLFADRATAEAKAAELLALVAGPGEWVIVRAWVEEEVKP